jgi:hypothetical protein
MRANTVAVVAFDGISPFHLSVPCLVFGEDRSADGIPRFDVRICAERPGRLRTSAGFSIHVPEFWAGPAGWRPPDRWFAGVSLAWTVLRLSIVALFVLALAFVARQPIERMALQLRAAPLATTLVGVAAQLLLLPALVALAVLLLVSIVGIPLLALLPFALLAGAIAWIAGFAAVAELIGEALGGRGRPFVSLVLGLLAIWSITIVARGAGLSVGGFVAGTLAGIGLAIEFVAWSAALGALILGWRRRRVSPSGDYAEVPAVPGAPVHW